MASRWPSVEAATEAGKVSELTRVVAGIPIMLGFADVIRKACPSMPLGLLIVKGAFESKGNPVTKSKVDSKGRQAVGLFQLFIGVQGLSAEELQNPEVNARAFCRLVRDRASKLLKTHGKYFPAGKDYQFWSVVLLTTMIGPGATRRILNALPAGGQTFDRLARFVETHPDWLRENSDAFGIQGSKLVAFRTMVTRQMVGMAKVIDKVRGPARRAAPWVGAVGVLAVAGTAGLLGYLYWQWRRAMG